MPKEKIKSAIERPVVAQTQVLPNSGFIERHVVIGDLHLRRTDPLGVIEQDGLNSRLKDKLGALNYAVDFALTNKATHIDLLGDVFDAVNPPENLKRLFWTAIRPAIDAGMWVTIIIGNHDTTGEFFNFAGDALIAHEKIRIVNKRSWTRTTDSTKSDIMYIPYLHKTDLLNELQTNIKNNHKPMVIFGHFEIEGAELAPDNTVIREGLDRTLFDDVDLVWLGHIHKFQELRPGMSYVGSAVKCDFGEVSNRKVFGVLDITDDHNTIFKSYFIDIPQRPMYQIVIAENNPDNLYLEDKIPASLAAPGVLIKFVIEGTKEWADSLDKQRFRRRFPQALRVKFETRLWDTDRPVTEVTTTNMTDRVHAFIKAKGKGQEYLNVGLMLAKQAQEVDL